MKKMELEIKILDVNKEELVNKLNKLGAKHVSTDIEKSYVYDLLGMNSRFDDIIKHINFYRSDNGVEEDKLLKNSYNEKDRIKLMTAIDRLKILFEEIDYLLNEKEREEINKKFGFRSLSLLVDDKNIIDIINDRIFKKFMEKFFLNHNKWMRLRETDGMITITIKHILPDNGNIQQLQETEIVVSNFAEANEFLETIGFHYKNYFEKERVKYEIFDHEIDIDSWPGIPTYFEIEGEDEKDLINVLEALGYNFKDAVSMTANKVFELYGKSMFDKRELKFEK